jgi:carboxyl-terminal processing protease
MKLLILALVAAIGVGHQDQASVALAVASFEDAWQTINDTFYDPTFGGLDWAAVRKELLPRAQAAKTADDVRDVIRDMIGRLKQSHFELLSDSNSLPGPGMIPIEIRLLAGETVITRVVPDSTASRAGLRPGQVVLAIDGAAADTWRPAGAARDARARDQRHWENAYRALFGADGSTATMRVRDPGGQERPISLHRDAGSRNLLTLGNMVLRNPTLDAARRKTPGGREVGLITFSMWMAGIKQPFDQAVDRFRSADALVIDLRGNPGGLMAMIAGISGHLIADKAELGTMRARGTPPLKMSVNPQLSTEDGRRVTPFAGPVAILVDEETASTSEIFAGALQSLRRARIFGRQTMGQALPASTKTLPNGDVLVHVVGDFVTTDGKPLEGKGVMPDEAVPLTIAALAAGRDADLDAALAWIDRARRLLLCSSDLQGTQFLPRWVAPFMRP